MCQGDVCQGDGSLDTLRPLDTPYAATAAAATSPWWMPYVAAGVAAIVGETVVFFKEHTKGARPSTKTKHQEGQARRQKDAGGEKGDARRTPRKDKKK